MTEDMTLVAYRQSEATQDESARCLLAAFAYLGVPKSLIDLGCGPGHLVRLAGRCGATAFGVDLHSSKSDIAIVREGCGESVHARRVGKWLICPGNLSEPGPMVMHSSHCGSYDMALCWEVAEHLPPEAADTLCDTTVSVLAPGGVLLWSAATPGQGGAGHLNEQHFHSYWLPKLEARGLQYDDEETGVLATIFATVAPSTPWYGNNLRILRKP